MLAKVALISQVNPEFRREDIAVEEIQSLAVVWGVGNGIAVIAVAVALVLLTSWRAGLLDDANGKPTPTSVRFSGIRCAQPDRRTFPSGTGGRHR